MITISISISIHPDTIQLIIMESRIRYCLFCISYRDTRPESKYLTNFKDEILNKEVLLWSINLGSIEKESVDSLVSETLVSLKIASYMIHI